MFWFSKNKIRKVIIEEQLEDLKEARDLYKKLWLAAVKARYIRQFDCITHTYKRYIKEELQETICQGYSDFCYRNQLAYQGFDNLCKLAK